MCYVVRVVTGHTRYFHADDPQKPKAPAFVGLKWAFFDSTGPVFVASLIQCAAMPGHYACTELLRVQLKLPSQLESMGNTLFIMFSTKSNQYHGRLMRNHGFHVFTDFPASTAKFQICPPKLSVNLPDWALQPTPLVVARGFGVSFCTS